MTEELYYGPNILEERRKRGQRMPWLEDVGHRWEKHYQVKKGDTVIHAGAYHGKFGRIASKKVGESGKVILIEPHRQAIRVMQSMIKELDLKNIILIECAVWSKKGEMGLIIPSDRVNPHLTNMKDGSYHKSRGCEFDYVEIDTIDNIIDDLYEFTANHVDLFVADVENAEVPMVKGMKKCLSKKVIRNLTIASYHKHPDGNYEEINQILRDYDYNVLPHTDCCYAHVVD